MMKRINSFMKSPAANPRGGGGGISAKSWIHHRIHHTDQQQHTDNCVMHACVYACLPHMMWCVRVCMHVYLTLCGACVCVCMFTPCCVVHVCVHVYTFTSDCVVLACLYACLPDIVWCLHVCMRVQLTLCGVCMFVCVFTSHCCTADLPSWLVS